LKRRPSVTVKKESIVVFNTTHPWPAFCWRGFLRSQKVKKRRFSIDISMFSNKFSASLQHGFSDDTAPR
jgi:hypothetical protein